MGKIPTAICISLLFGIQLIAQNPAIPASAGFSQPATVKSKPNVELPAEAKKTGIGGNVMVRVSVGGAGNVVSVDDISGPGSVCRHVDREDVRAIRETAHRAALETQFEPATADGKPVPSAASITFIFHGDRNNTENALINGLELPENPKGETNYSAADTPPDYIGPVNTIATTEKTAVGSEQKPASGGKTLLPGGVLNGKAAELPRPSYPPAARAVRASGSVQVQVLIDEQGEVFLARAVSGHPLLRPVTITAACSAKFTPTRLSGEPVKVSGIITYNFVP